MGMKSDFEWLKADICSLQQGSYKWKNMTENVAPSYINEFVRRLHGGIEPASIYFAEAEYFHEELFRIYEKFPDNAQIVGAYANGLNVLYLITYLSDFELDEVEEGIIYFERLRALHEKYPHNDEVVSAYTASICGFRELCYTIEIIKFQLEEIRKLFRDYPNNRQVVYHYVFAINFLLEAKSPLVELEEVETLTNKTKELYKIHLDDKTRFLYQDMLVAFIEVHPDINDKRAKFEELYGLHERGLGLYKYKYAPLFVMLENCKDKETRAQFVKRVILLNKDLGAKFIKDLILRHKDLKLEPYDDYFVIQCDFDKWTQNFYGDFLDNRMGGEVFINILCELAEEDPTEYLMPYVAMLSCLGGSFHRDDNIDEFFKSIPDKLCSLYNRNRDNPKVVSGYAIFLRSWFDACGYYDKSNKEKNKRKIMQMLKEVHEENPEIIGIAKELEYAENCMRGWKGVFAPK